MPVAQKLLSNVNLLHPPQYAIEGTGPGNYGRAITAAEAMVVPLQLTKMDIGYGNEFIPRLFKGEFDMVDEIKVWENDTVTIMGNVPINNIGLGQINWAMDKPPQYYADSATDTDANRKPHQSRTWFCSFVNANNKVVYIIAKGCKPQSPKISIQNKALAELEITMAAKRVYAYTNPTAIVPASDGSYAPPELDTTLTESDHGIKGSTVKLRADESRDKPLRFENALDFNYKPIGSDDHATNMTVKTTKLQYEGIDVGVDWTFKEQNSNGAIRSTFREHASRTATGTAAIYKIGQELNEDARIDTRRVAWFPLSAGTDVHAKATLVASKVIFYAGVPGAAGNGIKINVKAKGTQAKNIITVKGKSITITPATSPTWAQIKKDLDNHREASLLGTIAHITGSITAPSSTAIDEVTTQGGTDGARKIILDNMRFEPSNEQMQGATAATLENKTFSAFSVIPHAIV